MKLFISRTFFLVSTLALLFTCTFHVVLTGEKYPVDVCFMAADLKYNAQQKVKICEIQEGSLSLFNGDTYQGIEEISIYKNILDTLSVYNKNGWITSDCMADKNMVATLVNSSRWQSAYDITALVADPNFLYHASQPVIDRYDLSSYQGFLYCTQYHLSAIYEIEKRFPGMIILDKSSFPFWIDKYQKTLLFTQDKLLSTFKPKWGNYKKIYTRDLACQIAHDLQCDTFVIKPRGEFLGRGVIIVQRKDLDSVLWYIITKKGPLANNKDRAYSAWKDDKFDSFIVEEFVASDPITIPHLENKRYQPTMRVTFLLVYDKGVHHVHFLSSYWKTPAVSLDEEGDFMQKNKDVCEAPYYCAVDKKIKEIVHNELRIALPILHNRMLEFCSKLPKEDWNSWRQRRISHSMLIL